MLKNKRCKVQATTSNRTNINVAQQYCWHWAVDEVYEHLRSVNTRLCQSTGKTFGEVMPDFLIGFDKMCLMSDTNGDLCVFFNADKRSKRSYYKTLVAPSQLFVWGQCQALLDLHFS